MSGLDRLLAGLVAPGIHTWYAAAPAAEVARTVEAAGWSLVRIGPAATKQHLLSEIGLALDFPDHYGRNFDALADLLADLPGDVGGTLLLWEGWDVLAASDPQAFGVALSVLGTRVHAERGAPFTVLLAGGGSDVPGVGDLDRA